MASTVDIDAVSRILRHPEELPELFGRGIELTHFRDANMQRVMEFIVSHRKRTGSVPNPETVERETGFSAGDPPEPIIYYADEMLDRSVYYTLRDGGNKLLELLAERDIEAAVDLFLETGKLVRIERSRGEVALPISTIEPRIERYETVKAADLIGHPFPWKEVNDITLGWKPGEYGLAVARTGVGKTFFGLLCAHAVWMSGKRVLIVSMEMSPEMMHLRHDAMVSEVPLEGIFKGTLTPTQEKRYRETMEELRDYEGFDIIGHNMSASMDQIEAAIDLYEPDWILVDGAYMVRPSGFSPMMSRSEKMEMVANEMTQTLNRYKISGMNALQANREQKKTAREVDVANIYGSDAWGHNATYVFGLVQTKEDKADGVMRFALPKHRNGDIFAARVDWDLSTMSFEMLEFQSGVTVLPKPKMPVAPGVSW